MKQKDHKHIICTNSDTILNCVADGVFTVDKEMIITYFNKAAERITGFSKEDAIGEYCFNILQADICKSDCLLKRSYDTGHDIINRNLNIKRKDDRIIPVSISTAILHNEEGDSIGGVETLRDLSLIEELEKEIRKRYTFEDIISKNHHFLRLFDILPDIAQSDSTVLIEGESGTGKELFARALHNISGRSEQPFVIVNCGALPDQLLESELFGYKKGAFTDAKNDKLGRFALADNGTIFLDEVDSLSLSMQVKLLRVLEQKTFEPLGGTKTFQTNIRIIAATKTNLFNLVKIGQFRDDLYFRLNVIKIFLPPLSQRREDIPVLIEHFIEKLNKKKNRRINSVDEDAMKLLMNHNYLGNVRELENIIEHAFVMCKGDQITLKNLPVELLAEKTGKAENNRIKSVKSHERDLIVSTLEKFHGNKIKTANELGISRSTLWRKIKSYSI